MKIKLLLFLFFNFFVGILLSQEKKDSIKPKIKWEYKPNFMIGVDILHLGLIPFTDQKVIQAYITTRFKKKLHLTLDAGYEKNIYNKNGYDAKVSGSFIKLGTFYMLTADPEDIQSGFYVGGKLAGSFYQQTYNAVPIRGYQGGDVYQSFPSSNQSSYWLEGNIGARVKVFKSKFYIDAQLQPKYLLYSTKQENIQPMVVSGFGKSDTKFNFGFLWGIAYYFK